MWSTALSLSPLSQMTSGRLDLSSLSPRRWVAALVVSAQEEDQLIAEGVAEDANENPLGPEPELE